MPVARDLQRCHINRLMAAKIIMMKMLQELEGYAEVTNRCPQTRHADSFVMQLRSDLVATPLPAIRRNIDIDEQGLADAPHPVRITHLHAVSRRLARL